MEEVVTGNSGDETHQWAHHHDANDKANPMMGFCLGDGFSPEVVGGERWRWGMLSNG